MIAQLALPKSLMMRFQALALTISILPAMLLRLIAQEEKTLKYQRAHSKLLSLKKQAFPRFQVRLSLNSRSPPAAQLRPRDTPPLPELARSETLTSLETFASRSPLNSARASSPESKPSATLKATAALPSTLKITFLVLLIATSLLLPPSNSTVFLTLVLFGKKKSEQ